MDLRLELREYPSLFRTADAKCLGLSAHALAHSSRCRPLYRGVRVNEDVMERHPTPGWADQAWMNESVRLRGIRLLCPTVVGIGLTAARLFGLPLPPRLMSTPLHAASTDPATRLTHPGIVFRRLRNLRAVTWLNLPMQAPEDVFIDLATRLPRDALVAVGDALVGGWHGPPLCTLAQLRSAVSGRRYLRSRSTLEDACRLIRETVDSPQETHLRLWIIRRGLPEPEVHPQVYCPTLGRVVEPDLGYRRAQLALEYEGAHHFDSKEQWARDIARDEALQAAGWTVLKVTSRSDLEVIERRIRAHLSAT